MDDFSEFACGWLDIAHRNRLQEGLLGPPVVPFLTPFFGWEGSSTKIDYSKKVGTLILTSLPEDLVSFSNRLPNRLVGTNFPELSLNSVSGPDAGSRIRKLESAPEGCSKPWS